MSWIWQCSHQSIGFFQGHTFHHHITRVDQPVTKHLSNQDKPNPKGGLCYIKYPNKTWTPPLGTFDTLTIVKYKIKWKKLQPLNIKGFKNSKKKTTENYLRSKHPKNFILLCFFVIRVQKWFVKFQVALLAL
jgi:hypothetical protein